MANRNTAGFGLIPVGTIGATPATAGQGKYLIDAGYNADLFQGTAVKSSAGYIVTAQAAITNTCIGVLNGIFYNDATTKKPTFANFYNQPITPANSEDITAFVLDNPFQLFVGATSAAVTQANVGRTVSFAAAVPTGSDISGQCSNTLDIGNIHDTNNQWRLIRTAEDPENEDQAAAFCSFIVCQNLGQYLLNSATAGNDWTI